MGLVLVLAVAAGFAAAVVAPLLHRVSARFAGWLIALLPLALFTYFATFIGPVVSGEVFQVSYPWVPGLGVSFSLYVDGLGLLFALLITGVGALIVLYSSSYLGDHPNLGRFYAIILLFMGSMLGLVLAGNLLVLFVFWELTSITSYLLIGFDHHREEARRAALQALLVTGVGGLALLAGLVLLGYIGGTFDLVRLLGEGETILAHALALPVMLLIFLGAFTKSAQFPFHFWLPNAMEAPTPVSAYLHSATMVKAGVYLLARMSPIFSETDIWLYVVTPVGGATMLVGVFMAFGQTDLKRILAYATVSVLGILTMLIGLGSDLAIKAAMVFLLAHALYKAALFLIAGAIDHETGTRDIDHLGGLRRAMPITAIAAAAAAASMAAVPPLAGFISKEMFYEAALEAEILPLLVAAGAVLASMLMVALAWATGVKPFWGREAHTPKHPHEAPLRLWAGPVILAVLGVVAGIVPGATIAPFLGAAAASILADTVDLHLELWHGFNLVLGLSVATVAAGLLVYGGRRRILQAASGASVLTRRGPEYLYDLALRALDLVATTQTRILQSGYLRYYVMLVMAVTVALVGFTLAWRGGLAWPGLTADLRFYEIGVAGLILAAAITATMVRSSLAAAAALGTVGYGIAMIFIFFGAPDLAMTQILVETLTVILFVLVFYHLPPPLRLSRLRSRLRDGAIAVGVGCLMAGLVMTATVIQVEPPISSYFLEHSVAAAHGRNIVNVILVDFRALDTLGEITVLAIAAIGVYAMLKFSRRSG